MRNRMLTSVWTLAVCVPTLALAQQTSMPVETHREGGWELSLSGGIRRIDASLRDFLGQPYSGFRFANTATPGSIAPTAVARVGYNFTPHLGVSVSGGGAMGSGVTYLTPGAALTYTANLNARTSPFILVGTHLTRIMGQSDRVTHSTWGLDAGLGLRRMVGENVALRLEGRMEFEGYHELFMNSNTANQLVVTLGLSYFTRGRQPVPMAMAMAPARVRVDTVMRFRTDTVRQMRVDTVQTVRVDTVMEQSDQLVLRVQFQTDLTTLLPKSRPVLDTIAIAMLATPNARWEIQGHTDSIGTEAANKTLSQGRAQTVLEYLVSRGVNRGKLNAIGYGEDRPVFSNSTLAGRAQNRRVQIRRQAEAPTGPPIK